ncbi:uncharacterized protein DUF4178 [Aneurinibacillus soli]|uniref:DUF4178 domain-containing protein n=1 Tax=Aneurinibacillus soli TaxID=1500254 RepID=A0A0U5C6P4_9BACL|nr:DUF4178 domain-containing protein [Aneurinibacillus soli]PYE61360.1 uncharacterized protein DUF4178 [Aneurinibacillus soli]BAU27811.1 hypothetical protein CB4_01985 [Aneurinibacillus soli]
MSLFERIANILKKPEPPKPEKSVRDLGPGDIVEVSLVTYEVVGSTQSPKRKAVFLTLQDGSTVNYLKIEERERVYYELYTAIDGRLDSVDEIPTTIEMEDTVYHMEEQYSGNVFSKGKTPFSSEGEQYVWEFQSDNRKLLRIEWQDGRMMMYEGELVIPGDVKVIRAT